MADPVRDLAHLEQEERAISQRRRRLHERIDFIRGSGVHDDESRDRLAKLEAEEKEVSRVRRELHERIDALRSQAGAAAPPAAPKEGLERPGSAYFTSMQTGFGSLVRDDE